MHRLRGVSLFSGIGGIEYGLREWVETVAYVETNAYCRKVLTTNMEEGRLEVAPVYHDVKELNGYDFKGQADILTAGFPCQDTSVAGLRKGLGGQRTRLVFHALRVAKETSVPIIFLENVRGSLSHGGRSIVQALACMGYDARWCVVSAADCGAPHKRERWFCLAFKQTLADTHGAPVSEASLQGGRAAVSTAANQRLDCIYPPAPDDAAGWLEYLQSHPQNQPALCLGHDGLPHRLAALRSLGNACVPQQAALAFKILTGIEKTYDHKQPN